jgi:hypothetical protein
VIYPGRVKRAIVIPVVLLIGMGLFLKLCSTGPAQDPSVQDKEGAPSN